MGIKEVKSRLKQKVFYIHINMNATINVFVSMDTLVISFTLISKQELTENGFSDEPGSTHLPSTQSKDSLTWDQRRPITVHFGQVGVPVNNRSDDRHFHHIH